MISKIRIFLLVKGIQAANAVLSELAALLSLEALGDIQKATTITKGLRIVDQSECSLDTSMGEYPNRASLKTWQHRVVTEP